MTNYVCIGDTILKLDLIARLDFDGRYIKYYLINTPTEYYVFDFGSVENAKEAFISLKKQICIDTPK
jgi:hypothetical protein